ncbi:MAG: sigma-70 family RNA polymerase sigma factor, partial [Rhodocyclaceae bacterium]|nr:sigma-70 family RNA polymerase sigma factor [Rhodocyclaceae bacterium]
PEAAFRTWLFTIARNLAIDLVRRHRPLLASELQNAEDDGDPLERIADERRPSADEALDGKRMNARLHEALASLPAVQREAILLREYGEHSVEEIARITGVNAETAKSRLRYALGRLRSLLMPHKESQS